MEAFEQRAVEHLLNLLAIEGVSGRESLVSAFLKKELLAAGCRSEWIFEDEAHLRLGEGFETGNLIVRLPGTVSGERLLFSAHMDTVPLCREAHPVVRGNRVVSAGETGLGGDDRAGCAALLTMAEFLLKNKVPHPPITLLFTIAEEIGLFGAREVQFEALGSPVMGFNLDGEDPEEVVVGAMGAVRWTARIFGRSAHSGLEPEKGVSAGLVLARAISRIETQGYFGRIRMDGKAGTSNVGTIHGGEATNQVMDRVEVRGECRSHDADFLEKIVAVHQSCFEQAAESVLNDAGESARVEFSTESDYRAFRLADSEPCVLRAEAAVKNLGLTPRQVAMDAGLDANPFNEKGFPCVTLGTGTHHFHTVDEYVEIGEYQTTCRILLEIVRLTQSTLCP